MYLLDIWNGANICNVSCANLLLIAITFVDIDHFIIPKWFCLIGIFMLIFGIYTGWIPIEWEDAMSGSFVFAGFLFAIGLIGHSFSGKRALALEM
ncbi:MAG: hypothetical protein Ct9H90mP20_7270 [Candidatus Neomarinimicrobiota bacterium]|nr:MAG: hypothetical protein Ct9H90mP20_7270 [Candidatus Neomarinimicrobiota bacterium]